MCQKAFGAFFGPLVTAHDVVWTRGQPKYFRSSNRARRGFCGDCGTPLTYDAFEADGSIELAIGAFDNPQVAAPVIQVNPNDKLSFFDGLTGLPVRPAPSPHWLADIVSYQHPDLDTDAWPPGERV
jgi:hypothetical protein